MATPEGRPPASSPLTPAAFHVLVALAGGDLHGYAILKEVEERTGGSVRLSTGTLYGLVRRFLEDGWIAETPRRPGQAEDPRRRTYRLTAEGRAVAAAEARRLEAMVAAARDRRLLRGPA
jgi:DNA-binding PadR family transcriptional regulator